MSTVRVGVIGTGIRGRLFAGLAGEREGVKLVGACDVSSDRAAAFASDFDVAAYGSPEELLQKGRPDAVVVATPDFTHEEPALACARHRIPTMIEKPLATSREVAEKIRDAFARTATPCLVAFENRWRPDFVYGRRLIRSGQLGAIREVVCTLNDTLYVPTQMLSWAQKSSPVWFLGSHCIDLVRWMTGLRYAKVYAAGVRRLLADRGIDTYDAVTAVLHTEGNDAVVTVRNSWILPEERPSVFEFTLNIVGEAGELRFSYPAGMENTTGRYTTPTAERESVNDRLGSFPASMFDAFVAMAKSGGPSPSTLDDGVRATEVAEAIHTSLATGSSVLL